MIWVGPTRALSEPHVAMCGLEIRLPIPLKRAEARFRLSRFPTGAVQKNCTGLNPASKLSLIHISEPTRPY